MAVIIPIKDNSNHELTIELENIIYRLYFLYNEKFDYWSMSIFNEDDDLLLSGIKIVPNYPMIYYLNNRVDITGDFYCEISSKKTSSITRNSFVSGEANLLYLTDEEVATIK